MLKVVFDTVVFVRGLINPHGHWGRLIFSPAQDYALILSPAVIEEILEVIERPAIKQKYRLTQAGGISRLLEIMARAPVVEVVEASAVSRDPKDDKFLATARAAAADYLVSEDADLLDLGEYESTKIVDAARFLKILEEGGERE